MKDATFQSRLYDTLYQEGNKVLKLHNPCNFHKDKKGQVRCTTGTPCCEGCEHLGVDGCKVHSLACKLDLCGELRRFADNPNAALAYSKLLMLQEIGKDNGVPMIYRKSKEQSFERGASRVNPSW